MLVPSATSADTNLVIGQPAVISYANGDQVRLRETPNYEGTLIAMYDEGTAVTVVDGPVTDDAGNFWYQVSVNEQVGYIVADFLALDNGVPLAVVAEATEEPVVEETPVDVPIAEVPTETDPVAVVPEAPVSGAVIAFGWVAGTNGDGVRCRAAMDPNAPVITVLPEGTQVEITGPVTDIWQPINCMGGGGFVAAEFLTTTDPNAAPVGVPATGDGAADGAATETPVASETPATDGSATATPTASQTPVSEETPVATETAVPSVNPDEDLPEQTDDTQVLDMGLVSGAALVTGTNGDGVRCRARASSTSNTITIMPEGSTVQLTGVATGVWQPVFCNGSAGYISNTYLGSADAPSSTDSGDVGSTGGVTTLSVGAEVSAASLGGSSFVSGTNGDGVRCRTGSNTSSSTITVLSEGTSVSLRGLATGGWQPVVCAGSNGWISAEYLSASGGSSNSSGGSASTGNVSSTGSTTGAATVNSAPGGLNCRTSGSMSGSVITVLSHGSTVSLRGSASNGWQPVSCGGQSGYVSAQYLDYDGGTSGGSTSGGNTSGGTSGGGTASGTSLVVTGTGGGGVRLRSSGSLSGSILAIVPEGGKVTARNGSVSGWTAVTYNGTNGFISSDYLGKNGSTSGGSTSGGSTSGGSSSGGLVNGSHAAATDSLNLRYSASFSAGVAAVAPSGTVVLITGSASNGFYPVDWDGLKGFMSGDYLTKTSAALSERGGSGTPGGSNGGTPGGSSSGGATGNAIVDYAMRYLGYPYVWATHGPSSFDCSGFTYWVVLNVLGRDIGAGTWTQVSAGASVSRNSLQPGDLVFFQNTYEAGLSHVGIYIGNDQFIHAENESTGVRISDLNSSYYASRWYGAVRLT
jgi:cell wall-associated NlpC family hydrolase